MQSNSLANISLQQLKQAVTIREKIEVLEKEMSRIIGAGSMAQEPILINRAPVLTLWSSVVAERLGFDRKEALSLAKAVA